MKYFKNTELARIHKVSEKSVRNWIEAATNGKLDLQLFEQNGKSYIANTSKNSLLVAELVQKGKKYINSRGFKTISPTTKFYELYNSKQILDIISSVDIHREIPHKYSYFDGGAVEWDLYSKKLMEEPGSNALKSTLFLLDINAGYIDSLVKAYDKINVIDIGVGNGMPVKGLLEHLLKANKLGRYIGIDISQDMLEIAEQNIQQWFGDKVAFEGYARDITQDRFEDLTLRESLGNKMNTTANVILFLGGTISSFREPDQALSIIHSSMGKDDLLIFSKKPDTENSRRYFDFAVQSHDQELDTLDRMIPEMLGLHKDLYTIEQFFDETKMARQIQITLDIAVAINFELDGGQRVIEVNKGESILLWRANHQNTLAILDQFSHNGFELLQTTKSPDQEYLLLISKIKTER